MWLSLFWFAFIHPAIVWADTTSYQDVIQQYDVDITLQSNGQAEIVERISYDFGLYSGHGIYRSLPARYVKGILNDNLEIDLDSVTDERGRAWSVKTVSPGDFNQPAGNLVWRIGDPDQSVDGEQTYVIKYTVDWVMLHYQEYSELYWNAIGTQWDVPIEDSRITVHVPPDSLSKQYQPTCYTGVYGETGQTCVINQPDEATIVFDSGYLLAHEGVTIDVGFIPVSIQRPTTAERLGHLAINNWSLGLLPLIALGFIIFTVLDRPARSRRPIIPIYEAPAHVTPAMTEHLMIGRHSARTLTATLIELARTGFIHFVYDDKKKAVTILKKVSTEPITEPVTATINQTIFRNQTEVVLKQTVINKTQLFQQIKSLTRTEALKQGWFRQSRLYMYYLGVAYATLMGTASGFMIVQGFSNYLYHWGVTGLLTLVMIITYAIVHRHYRPLSPAGADLVNELEGFKWFLRVTEQERVKFTSAPKLTPQLFEQFLPYAVAFGVEKEWVDQFKHILVDPPAWMEGNVTNLILVHALLSTSHVSSDFKVPQTRSSSGGFGGGGFSGGGFGGGGGGRW